MLIVPSVAEAVPDMGRRMVRDALDSYKRFGGSFKGGAFVDRPEYSPAGKPPSRKGRGR
jgi:hypothetical protein